MSRPTLANPHLLPAGCPLPTDDLEGFLRWHREGPLAGFRMDAPDDPPAGGTGGDGGQGGGAPAGDPPAGGTGQPRTFTQEELTARATAEKQQGERAGRRAALKPFADALGLDVDQLDPAQLATLAKTAKDEQAARETEAETRAREATEALTAERLRNQTLTEQLLNTRRDTALVAAGIVLPADPTERLAALEQARGLLQVPADADDATLTAAVTTLRTRFATLFSAQHGAPGTGAPPPPAGAPTGTPPRSQATGDAFSKGAERAKALSPS